MKRCWVGGIAMLVISSSSAQDVEELQRKLKEQEHTIHELRQRIALLERVATPRRVNNQFASNDPVIDSEGDSNRALERALVRERGLLLSPRTYEIETNLVYSHSSNAGFRRDSYGPGLTVRAGLPWKSQIEVSLPYVFERLHINSVKTHSHGKGDLMLGLSHQLSVEKGMRPSIISFLNYQAATGRNTVFEPGSRIAHGSGFKSLQAGLTAIKRVDPLVYFGSYTYTHIYSDLKNGIAVRPGGVHGVRFGTALATAPTTSLRAAFNLNFFGRSKQGKEFLTKSDPTAFLEVGGSAVLTESIVLDVLIGAGLTRSTPDFRVIISLPIRF